MASLQTVVALVTYAVCTASIFPQDKKNRSDEDISAIGYRSVGKGANFYSPDREKELGKQLAKEVERSSKLIDDPDAADYLNSIAQNIAKNSDARLAITIRVIDSDLVDAFTLPGGFQYVNKGLILQTEGEAELAGVLAHGIAYTAIRASTKEATKGELMQLATVPLILLGPGGWSGYGIYEGLNLSFPVTYLKFRRDAEKAADYFGLQYVLQSRLRSRGFCPFCRARLAAGFSRRTFRKSFLHSRP